MNTIIAVFEKNWIETQMLFKFLSAFNISIQGQDAYGDRSHDVKEDYLFVDNETKIAQWINKEIAINIHKRELCSHLHYDAFIFNLKKMYVGNT